MADGKYAIYTPAAPYFDLIRNALGDLVDGEHFFDVITEDTVYEVRYQVPGWPAVIHGRDALMSAFQGYVRGVKLHKADSLFVHQAEGGQVVVIEYDVHGKILGIGSDYHNRFCSVITLNKRKIAHWRDYMDSLAAWNALTGNVQ